jgi:carnosine N-methyltransferase
MLIGSLGPLLYHFEDSASGDASIELSLEQVKEVAKKIGFEFKVYNIKRYRL